MPRPRHWDRCDEIAQLIGQGRSIQHTADALSVSRGVVVNRMGSMRARLAEVTGEPAWLSPELRTHVQTAQAWLDLAPGPG